MIHPEIVSEMLEWEKRWKLPALPLLTLGQTSGTPGALAALEEAGISPVSLLKRHHTGDWGDLDDHDRAMNAAALRDGERVFSSYRLPSGVKVWVITEANRSQTLLLLPDEY